jgi:hypothetical protein
MVNLSSNNSNNINLSGQTQRNVNVSTSNTNNVDANTMGNSQRARSWAIGEGLIDGEDYSAKHYAQLAEEAASKELDMVQGSETIEVIRDTDSITIATKNFVYTQATASDTWEITHNLGKRPSVIIEDSEGKRFYPPVEDIDNDTCIVHLLGATTGTAYLN